MKVKQLMSSNVQFTTPTSNTKEAAKLMHDQHVGALPVIADDQLVGIITDRDICCKVTATGRDAGWTRVEEVMTKEVFTCFDDLNENEAADIMIDHHIRRLAVINDEKAVVGLLSVDDLAHSSHELACLVLEASDTVH